MTEKWHGGKGSKPRPIDKKKYDENYDRIFNKKKENKPSKEIHEDEFRTDAGC